MLPDPRDRRGRRHALASVLAVSAAGRGDLGEDVAGAGWMVHRWRSDLGKTCSAAPSSPGRRR